MMCSTQRKKPQTIPKAAHSLRKRALAVGLHSRVFFCIYSFYNIKISVIINKSLDLENLRRNVIPCKSQLHYV